MINLKNIWTCPLCGRKFRNANQYHSCITFNPEDHFTNKPAVIKEIYEKLLSVVNDIGEVNISAVKSAIFIKTFSTYIEIKPKKKLSGHRFLS